MIKLPEIAREFKGDTGHKKRNRRGVAAKPARQHLVRAGEFAYAALFETVEEGGYVAKFPAFGNLGTQGHNLAAARAMAADCLAGVIACMLDEGKELPPATWPRDCRG